MPRLQCWKYEQNVLTSDFGVLVYNIESMTYFSEHIKTKCEHKNDKSLKLETPPKSELQKFSTFSVILEL